MSRIESIILMVRIHRIGSTYTKPYGRGIHILNFLALNSAYVIRRFTKHIHEINVKQVGVDRLS